MFIDYKQPAVLNEEHAANTIASQGAVQIGAPFADWSKSEVFAYARTIGLPIDLTYSCEVGGARECGKCLSCIDRKALTSYA